MMTYFGISCAVPLCALLTWLLSSTVFVLVGVVHFLALRFTAGVSVSVILDDREASINDLLGIVDVLWSWIGVKSGKRGRPFARS